MGLAIATAALGISTYGADTALAATPTPAPAPSVSSEANHPDMDRDAMIKHCTDRLLASERDAARKRMEDMMSAHGSAGESMMNHMPGATR